MRIQKGYKKFIENRRRHGSKEVDFGFNWKLRTGQRYPLWRLSWIENTGELYAVNMKNLDDFIVIGKFNSLEDVENFLSGWTDAMFKMGLIEFIKQKL